MPSVQVWNATCPFGNIARKCVQEVVQVLGGFLLQRMPPDAPSIHSQFCCFVEINPQHFSPHDLFSRCLLYHSLIHSLRLLFLPPCSHRSIAGLKKPIICCNPEVLLLLTARSNIIKMLNFLLLSFFFFIIIHDCLARMEPMDPMCLTSSSTTSTQTCTLTFSPFMVPQIPPITTIYEGILTKYFDVSLGD